MSRMAVQTLETAPEQARPTLERLTLRTGRLLNIHAEMVTAPVGLAACTGVSDALAQQSSFDARTREAIVLAVGAQDGCDYWQAAHTPTAITSGLIQAETVAIRRGTGGSDPKLSALLAVAREAAANVGEVSNAIWSAAVQGGWSELELSEAFAHLAVNLFTHYFDHYARTDLHLPAAPALTP